MQVPAPCGTGILKKNNLQIKLFTTWKNHAVPLSGRPR